MSAVGWASDLTAKIVIDAVGKLLQTGFECVEASVCDIDGMHLER